MRFFFLSLLVVASPMPLVAAEETNAPALSALAAAARTQTTNIAAAAAAANSTNTLPVASEAGIGKGATNASPAAPLSGFEIYKIIAERNIFDPNRQKPGVRRTDEEAPKPVKIDYLTLLGSMSYEKGDFAFFDGTSSEFRKSVKAGDSIAGYKVKAITQTKVTLENDGKSVELPVGSQMKRQDEGEWKLNAELESYNSAPASSDSSHFSESGRNGDRDRRDRRDRYSGRSSTSETSSSSTTSSTSPSSSSSSGDTSDALKRLLERRAKE